MRALIPVIFFLSGACGLVYQVVWSRMLTVVFGATIVAVSTTLAAFMAGLALGSFLFGRRVDHLRRPLRVFAMLEAGIGLYAFFFPELIDVIARAAVVLQSHVEIASPLFPILRFLLSFLLLLIPTALMGATLPAMSRYVVRRYDNVGGTVAWLYAVNTFGAVAGVALVTFILMEWLGLRGSTYVVGATNLLVAALAWTFGSESLPLESPSATDTVGKDDRSGPLIPDNLMNLIIVGFALSGFAALGYEIAWLRLLFLAFAINTHYEFSIILIAFLLGIALGSFICSRFLDARKDLLTLFGGMEVLIGLMGVACVLLFVSMTELIGFVRSSSEWWKHRIGIFAVAFAIMLLPTLLMGALFPVVGRLNTKRLGLLGRGIGDVYAANSLGAVAGAFATGFLLIPAFGTVGTFQVLGALNLIVGVTVLLLHSSLSLAGRLKVTVVVVAVTASFMLLAPSDLVRRLAEPKDDDHVLLFFSEGREGVVTVSGRADGYRRMLFNNGGQVPTDYGSFQLFRLLGHLPLLIHEDPRDVLVIALGGGIALGAVAQYDLESVVCVEMVPDVIHAARQEFGPFNHHVLETIDQSQQIDLIVDDGRNYLLSSPRKYDVITGDATHPTSTDSWVLYTADFYELCRSRLRDGGMFVQWLPFHGLQVDDYKAVLRTFQHVFPHASLWRTNNFAIMVGTVMPLSLDIATIEERFARDQVYESLAKADLGSTLDVLSTLFMDEISLAAYVGDSLPINTDDHPHLSFAGKRGFRASITEVYGDMGRHLADYPTDISPYIVRNETTPEGIDRLFHTYLAAKEYVLRGDWLRSQRRWEEAEQAYLRALEVNPRERTARHFHNVVKGG